MPRPPKTPPAHSLRKSDYESLAAWRFALRQFLRFSEDAATAEGVTAQQHQALLAIKGYPGRDWVTIGELGERLQVKHHSAVGLVDRLAAEKLVARRPAPNDGRKVAVVLTPRGEETLARLSAAHWAELRRIGPAFRELLERIAPAAGNPPPQKLS